MNKVARRLLGLITPSILVGACGTASPEIQREDTSTAASELWYDARSAPFAAGATIPICWARNLEDAPWGASWDEERFFIQQTVQAHWGTFFNLNFTWASTCPTSGAGTAVHAKLVRYGGGTATGTRSTGKVEHLGVTGLLPYNTTNDYTIGFNLEGAALSDTERFREVVLHEFGHALGFFHEFDRADNPNTLACARTTSTWDAVNYKTVTVYDPFSILSGTYEATPANGGNSCPSNRGLSHLDIAGGKTKFGARAVPQSVCASSPFPRPSLLGSARRRADMAAPWNNGGNVAMAVYPSTGASMGWQNWSTSPAAGAWDDSHKWAAGDFNGDGIQDVAAVWEGHGNNVTLRLSNGGAFTMTTSLVSEYDAFSYSGKWLPGDFDGNGRDDLAYVYNDGGKVSMNVFLSFLVGGADTFVEYQGPRRVGGWTDETQWVVGYFDNDDKADIAAIYQSNGSNAIAVRLAGTYSTFFHTFDFPLQQSAVSMGGWSSAYKWMAGDFNGDGLTDLACAWNQGGYEQVSVYRSTGSAANMFFTTWSAWDNSAFRYTWAPDTKWVVGDFNGDGKSDVASVWHNLNAGIQTNAVTVRLASPVGNAPAVQATSFAAPQVWTYPGGAWADRTQWCGGKFTP